MIYIITIHHETDKFIDLQEKYYTKYTHVPYKIYAGLCDANNEHYFNAKKEGQYENFHFVDLNAVENQHWFRMNYLVQQMVANETSFNDDDLLIFTDGDAFPIWEWSDLIANELEKEKVEVVAINRQENPEPALAENFKPYPHPCFFATKFKFWTSNGLAWSLHPPEIQTAGPVLKLWLESQGLRWVSMLRTNVYDLHPLYFGVYGGMIYHHGAGNREVYDSIDIWPRKGLNPSVDLDLRYPSILKFNKRLSDLVYDEIIRDDSFINIYIMGREG
jgi:CRISPR/Cas system-associated protein endoribonuclease Cas2